MTKPKPHAPRRRRRASTSLRLDVAPQAPPAPSPRVPAEPAPLPQLLTIDEVAEQLRTTRKAIYALIYKGALPGVIRLSRRLLVSRADLVKWLEEKRAASRIPQGDPR